MELGRVIEGEYYGKQLYTVGNLNPKVLIRNGAMDRVELDRSIVSRVVVLNEPKDASATIGIEFKDGKKSIIECTAGMKDLIIKNCQSLNF